MSKTKTSKRKTQTFHVTLRVTVGTPLSRAKVRRLLFEALDAPLCVPKRRSNVAWMALAYHLTQALGPGGRWRCTRELQIVSEVVPTRDTQ
jgi:hypothetical protein